MQQPDKLPEINLLPKCIEVIKAIAIDEVAYGYMTAKTRDKLKLLLTELNLTK